MVVESASSRIVIVWSWGRRRARSGRSIERVLAWKLTCRAAGSGCPSSSNADKGLPAVGEASPHPRLQCHEQGVELVRSWEQAECQGDFGDAGISEPGGAPRSGLRWVLFGGEAVDPRWVRAVTAAAPPARLLHVYGPTECTTFSTWWRVEQVGQDAVTLPIGRPLANYQAYVCDPRGGAQPLAVTGELLIGGDGLARGYHRRPAVTAERFVPDRFGVAPGRRLYRTGDLVRRLGDGEIEFVGRIDHQVKLRGFRIELGEIQTLLGERPEVGECALMLRQDAPGDKRLVAYVVPRSEGFEVAALRRHLLDKLPEFMVPSTFVRLDTLPLTPNGKLDRRRLPAPPKIEHSVDAEWIAPSTPTEIRVADLWSEVLGVENPGVEDDFFDAGGHSLLATSMVARLREELAVEVPLRRLFEEPTLRALATRVEALLGRDESAPELVPRPPSDRCAPVALSFAQERLWFLERLEPGSSAYLIPGALRLDGPLDPAALESALKLVAERHESLRTVFFEGPEGPLQRILDEDETATRLPLTDLSGLDPELAQACAEALLSTDARRPMDLATGPLVTLHLLRLGPRQHLLGVVMHHLISDGLSVEVFLDELAAAYSATLDGRELRLATLPLQYADYALWQRDWLVGERLRGQIEYWRQRLDGLDSGLDLPTDRPRRKGLATRPGVRRQSWSKELSRAVEELARRQGTTLFMVLLAAIGALLGRLSGSSDVAVGAPVAGRARAEVEGLIGFFLNTLVMRLKLFGTDSFADLLERAKKTAVDAYSHQDVPFEKLLEELKPRRDRSRPPYFQVLLNVLTLAPDGLDFSGLDAELLSLPPQHAKFDWTLYVSQSEGRIHIRWVYAAELYSAERMAETARQLEHLLARVTAAPDAPLGRLSLITAEARRALPDPTAALRVAWRGPVHARFARRARTAPERPAVKDPRESWTYGELEHQSARLATELRRRGVQRGQLVALWGQRSAALAWGLLGVLRADAAFVMLDPSYPARRLRRLIEHCHPNAALVMRGAGALPSEVRAALDAVGCIPPLELLPKIELEPLPEPVEIISTVGPSDPAYLAFTSGSSGRPKGVLGHHGALGTFVEAIASAFDLGPRDRFSVLSGLAHDPLHRDLLTPLQLGAAIVFPDSERLAEPGYLAGWLRDARISAVHLTPAMANLVLSEAAVENGTPRPLPDLRLIFTVGDALRRRDAERLMTLAPAARLASSYGSTETSRGVTFHRIEPGSDLGTTEVLPLGRGLEDSQLLVLNQEGRQAGIGELGENAMRSPHLAHGYLEAPAATAAKLVPHAGGAPGERLYLTGDLGRYLPDGAAVFAGRADQQIKVRGFRVELGEIAAVLERHSAVAQAVVVACPGRSDETILAAYVVPMVGQTLLPRALRSHLAEHLPDYMVPATFVTLDAMPLTPNRKLDRRALPEPELGTLHAAAGYQAPRTPAEELMVETWAAMLEVERVGATDDFFELGGHSLLATRLVARLRAAFGVEVPLKALFDAPTPAALARRLDLGLRRSAGTSLAPPLRSSAAPAGGVPLSFSQERLWFLDQLEPGSPAYNMPQAVGLKGTLDATVLGRAVAGLVARQAALRAVFPARSGRPGLRLVSAREALEQNIIMPAVDLTHLADDDARRVARQLRRDEALRPFELDRGPLWRTRLLRLRANEHWLLFTLHHIVSDGWSTGIVVRELAELYAAGSEGRRPELEPLPVTYADFARWQRDWLRGEVLETQLAYWRRQLTAVPVLELPTDRPRPARRSGHGDLATLSWPVELGNGLMKLARRHEATLYMTLLATFQTLLGRLSGQDDLAIGSPVAGRDQPEVEGLVGFFVNTLVLRANLGGDPTFTELLARTREAALGAYAHQDVPFEKLVEELQPQRDLSHTPIFQVLLALQNQPAARLELPGLEVERLPPESRSARFDLSLYLQETGDGGIEGWLEIDLDLFDAAFGERLLERYRTLVEGVVADPDQQLSELPVLLPGERYELLEARNDTAVDTPPGTVLDGFEAQAARTPHAVAVECGDQRLSYRELDLSANRLAHQLLASGLRPANPVGVCLERGVELPLVLLAIHKAGGWYLPLDPSLPGDRLRFLIEDSGVTRILTRGPVTEALAASGAEIVRLDVEGAAINRRPAVPTGAPHDPGMPAYALYTSGSTGRPKGVLISHRAFANFLDAMRHQPGLSIADTLLAVTTLSFDIAGLELFGPLVTGARVVVATRAEAADAERLRTLIEDRGVTVMQATPATWRLLTSSGWPARGLKALCGGEALARELADEILSHGAELWNLYGPTETTVWSSVLQVGPGRGPITLGQPIANTRLYVVDRHGRPAPFSSAGELWIGGCGLAMGYLGRAALSAQSFVPDPFARDKGARLYRTGDLVRTRHGGELEFLGRIDFQVKVRGFRIELGEIESVLEHQDGVAECVVTARGTTPENLRLVAYYVASPDGDSPDAARLRRALRDQLPDYMVPAAYVELDTMPLTPNRKIDRRALPEPVAAAIGDTAYQPPRSPLEALVTEVFAAVLELERVGIDDGFFELGGHSLLATQAIARLEESCGLILPLRALFDGPTPRALAERLERVRVEARGGPPPPVLEPVARDTPLPLSFSQERQWLLERLEPGSSAFNIASAFRLDGPLEPTALSAALAELVRRHAVLRSRFSEFDGEPRQEIVPFDTEVAPTLPMLDLEGLSPTKRADLAASLAAAESHRAFDLEHPPLLRAVLVRLGEQRHRLLLTVHHIVSDGWSSGVLVRELVALYGAAHGRCASPLPEPRLQYADFAAWQRRWLTGATLDAQLGYWSEKLASVPALELPTDRPRPALLSSRGARRRLSLGAEVSARLGDLTRRRGVTLFMALLAAFQALLARLSGQRDFAVGTFIANRNRAETEVELSRDAFAEALRVLMYYNSGNRSVPLLVRQAHGGDYRPFAEAGIRGHRNPHPRLSSPSRGRSRSSRRASRLSASSSDLPGPVAPRRGAT